MELFTASWFTPLPDTVKRVGICRYAPRGQKSGYRMFNRLAPGPWFNQVTPSRYMELYQEQVLAPLDVDAMLRDLETLAEGNDVALLCFEKPRFVIGEPGHKNNWCHRRVVSARLDELGIRCPEYGVAEDEIGLRAEQWVRDELRRVRAGRAGSLV